MIFNQPQIHTVGFLQTCKVEYHTIHVIALLSVESGGVGQGEEEDSEEELIVREKIVGGCPSSCHLGSANSNIQ